METLANDDITGTVLGDGGIHGEIPGDGIQNAFCTGARALGNADGYRRVAMLTFADVHTAETTYVLK